MSPEELWAELGPDEGPETAPERRHTREETQMAAELVVFLEDDIGVDVRRLHIKVNDGFVYLQGSVDTEAQRKEIEFMLPSRPQVKGFEARLTVQKRRTLPE